MICLKSTKSELCKLFQQTVVTNPKLCLFHHVLLNNQLIKKKEKLINKKSSLRWDSNPQCLCFEATKHLCNKMSKENFRKRL